MSLSSSVSMDLLYNGYVVVPVIDPERTALVRQQLRAQLVTAPELKPPSERPARLEWVDDKGKARSQPLSLVGGGFCAGGFPSWFHNKTTRLVEEWCFSAVVPVMRGVLELFHYQPGEAAKYKLEQIKDRVMLRPKGIACGGESVHRDRSPRAKATDHIFGGWVNLDPEPQHFVCAPRTHNIYNGDASQLPSGFFKLSAAEKNGFKLEKVTVPVPQGHMLVFFENIKHAVVSQVAQRELLRVFTAWRLTKSEEALYGNVKVFEMLTEQAAMPLKSNQKSAVFPSNWYGLHMNKLLAYSQAVINPALLKTRRISSGEKQGTKYKAVPMFLQSTKALGLPMQPEYTGAEVARHMPGDRWTLKACGVKERRRVFLHKQNEQRSAKILERRLFVSSSSSSSSSSGSETQSESEEF